MVKKIPEILISEYQYDLPEERIALFPLSERDQSKLLIWRNGEITESVFAEIDRILPERSLLISNNTRVIHARLIFFRPSGARIEVFCLEPWLPADYQLSFSQLQAVEWKCLVGNAKKWKEGVLNLTVITRETTTVLRAEIKEKQEDAFIVRFSWDQPVTFAEVIEAAGHVPIPPYLNRPDEEVDRERYQTTYAKIDGSVAAPTAGLHFTEEVIQKLKHKEIFLAELTLHVGAGTFRPVRSEDVSAHRMHTETVKVTRSLIRQLLSHPGKIIAVGTTSVRSLESLYWLGIKASDASSGGLYHVDQWEPYRDVQICSTRQSLLNILSYLQKNKLDSLTFTTSLIIVPGYEFRIIDGMFTNFHQPRSTLLLLIAAFLGPDWRKVYSFALDNGFRFLSYGDSNLYLRDGETEGRMINSFSSWIRRSTPIR